MLTPERVQEIRAKSGLNPIQVKGTSNNFVGKYDYLKNADKPSVLDKIGTALNKRFTSLKDTFWDTAEGDINPAETGVQTVGQVAGIVGDLLGIGIDEVTPEPIKKKIEQIATEIVNTPAAKSVMESYSVFKQKHPQAAKDLESSVDILALLPIGKGAQIVGKGAKAGAGAVEAGVKSAIVPTGKAMEKASEVLYKSAIPLSKQEARLVQSYKAKNPLLQRIFEPLETQPRTKAITALEKGFAGSEEAIGIQAKREAKNLWDNTIAPAVKSIQTKYSFKKAIANIEKEIKTIAEPSRRNDMLEALDALKADYKGIDAVTFERAQSIKSGLDEFTPEKVFNGKSIASTFTTIKNKLANDIRKRTYEELADIDIRMDYLDYGNLKGLAEYGITAMTTAGRKAGFGSFVSNLWDRATTPLFTGAGKVLKKAGQSLNK
jgi:hypothetical protein